MNSLTLIFFFSSSFWMPTLGLLEQAPQGCDHSTKHARVQEAFGQWSQAPGANLEAVLYRGRSWTWWCLWIPSNSGYFMLYLKQFLSGFFSWFFDRLFTMHVVNNLDSTQKPCSGTILKNTSVLKRYGQWAPFL